MLAVSRLRSSTQGERSGDACTTNLPTTDDDFAADIDFDFDFSEIFAGFDDAEVLPGLEGDSSDILVDFPDLDTAEAEDEMVETAGGRGGGGHREEMVLGSELQEEASTALASDVNLSRKKGERGRKASAGKAKGSNCKRKLKVDWTPELHRRFVEAVEQLGVEKAVPSRILELMGINCLTRHNVASHLQKYRCHRKHMMVREAEAARWSQRRQVYGVAARSSLLGPKREMKPGLALTMGFPPNNYHDSQSIRPLHVWGHPSMDQSLAHMWPKHLFPIRPATYPPWVRTPPALPHGPQWHPHFGTLTQGTPYFPQPLQTMRLPGSTSRPDSGLQAATPPAQPLSKQKNWLLPLDAHPSKESIDAAIRDVLAQPLISLPLGLKPPSLESVMVELHKQGILKVPPCN